MISAGVIDGDFAKLLIEKDGVGFGLADIEIDLYYAVVAVKDDVLGLVSMKETKLVLCALKAGDIPGKLWPRAGRKCGFKFRKEGTAKISQK